MRNGRWTWILLGLPPCLAACGTGATSELDRARARIDALERENAELRERLDGLERRLEAMAARWPTDPVTPVSWVQEIDAIVLSVDESLRLVVLNKGKQDGVKVGHIFDVYRGSQYKGQVRIQDVQEAMSSGTILSDKNPIAKGDSATTNL